MGWREREKERQEWARDIAHQFDFGCKPGCTEAHDEEIRASQERKQEREERTRVLSRMLGREYRPPVFH